VDHERDLENHPYMVRYWNVYWRASASDHSLEVDYKGGRKIY